MCPSFRSLGSRVALTAEHSASTFHEKAGECQVGFFFFSFL
jgi:hypothetical protein